MRSLEQLDRWITGKVRNWTGRFAGGASGKELLEVRREILEDVRDNIQPAGEGRTVFPYTTVSIRIAGQDEREREACAAAFAGEDGIERDIRELLAEAGARLPPGFNVAVEVVDDPALAWSGHPFRVSYASARSKSELKSVAGRRPAAKVRVLRGETDTPECEVQADRFNIGRLKEVVAEKEGLRRRNDLAFAESETTVSREHATIRYDAASGRFRLYDSNSQRGTVIFREGRRLDVTRGGAGLQLRSGDEIHLGSARLLFEEGESGPE